MRLVEFFGVPGSGKSTLSKALMAELGGTGRHALGQAWRDRSIAARGLDCVRAAVSASAVRILPLAPLARGTEARRRLMALPLRRLWLQRQKGLILLDQGMMQQIWSIAFAAPGADDAGKRYSALIDALYEGLPALIVSVEVGEAEALERIAGRENGHSKIDRVDQAERRAMVARAAIVHRQLVEAAERVGVEVMRLDGHDDPARLHRTLAASLSCRVSADAGTPDEARPAPSAAVHAST